MWVYILRAKSDASVVFKKFNLLFENEANHKLKVLRTDRGGEFLSSDFSNFCESHGILYHLTAPYTPQQNGVVK